MRWGGVVIGAWLAGCHVFDASLLDRADAAVDADADAELDADTGPIMTDGDMDAMPPACPLRLPPPRPAIEDGEDTQETFFAMRGIDLDQGAEWTVVGYDLDGLCSIGEAPIVECLPPARSGMPEIDGEGGIDNVFAHQAVPLVLLGYPELETDAQYAQSRGLGVILIRLRGWNGEATDARVDATMALSSLGVQADDSGEMPREVPQQDAGVDRDDAGYIDLPPPLWDGRDFWFARTDNFLDGDLERPRIRDDTAYMVDRTLVMRLPDRFPITFNGLRNGNILRLTDAVFTARFSEDYARVEEAMLAGRWAILDILESVPLAGVCPGTDNYAQFVRVLDLTADIRSAPGSGGPRVLCDALSVGIRFTEGVRGRFGGLFPPETLISRCATDAGR